MSNEYTSSENYLKNGLSHKCTCGGFPDCICNKDTVPVYLTYDEAKQYAKLYYQEQINRVEDLTELSDFKLANQINEISKFTNTSSMIPELAKWIREHCQMLLLKQKEESRSELRKLFFQHRNDLICASCLRPVSRLTMGICDECK